MKYLEGSLTFASPAYFVEALLKTNVVLYNITVIIKKSQQQIPLLFSRQDSSRCKTCTVPWAFSWAWPLASWLLLACLQRNESHPCLPAGPCISTGCHRNKSLVAPKHSSYPACRESVNSLQPNVKPLPTGFQT